MKDGGRVLLTEEKLVIDTYRGFRLDDFQKEAICELEKGKSVLVSAPTGVGKTLIADYLIEQAILKEERIIYTAPIKALSNQKYKDFKKLYGKAQVGIVTGDIVINAEAPVCLMTTEILRNILHQDRQRLAGITHIIFDEIHYLSDEDRGTVWEESLIFMPDSIRILGLSATIPNVTELAGWIAEIKSHPVSVVTKKERVVPLKHFLFEKHLSETDLKAVLRYQKKLANDSEQKEVLVKRDIETTHADFIKFIQQKKSLPCLYFVFSRRMCETKAEELSHYRSFLTTAEVNQVEAICERFSIEYGIFNMKTFFQAKACLIKGIGYHHAGLLPGLKEIVETLFAMGLIKVMYATETFAVGINYPVKTVCFDSPAKYDGITFRPLNNLEYFQMAGRAGRRGIDDVGMVYILANLYNLRVEEFPSQNAEDIEELKSQFNLSYNSVLNLKRNHHHEEIEQILNQNFATYQAREDKRRFEAQLKKKNQEFDDLSSHICDHRHDPNCPIVYRKIRQKIKKKQRRLRFIKGRAREAVLKEISLMKQSLEAIQVRSCSEKNQKTCTEQILSLDNLNKRLSKLEERAGRIITSGRFSDDLKLKQEILEELDYLKEGELLPRGEFAAQIYIQELLITELYFNGIFHNLDVDQLNALIVGVDYEPRKGEFYPRKLPFEI